jgi:butyryl-CoA dehydrogenase
MPASTGSSRPALWSDLFLTNDQIAMAEAARTFARKEIEPWAARIDEQHEFPREIVRQLGEMGFMGIMVPSEWGGAGLDVTTYTAILEEIATACATSSVIMSVNNSLACYPLQRFGTDTQKEEFLKPLAQGKKLGCYCLSEPGSGSDAAAMKTRAVKKGKSWILNGVKNFITNGREADIAIVYAVTEPEKKHNGIGAFVLDNKMRGYSVGKVERKLGIRGSSTTQIVLENVEVPEERVLGTPDQGFKIAMNTLDGGRIGIACQAIGIARAACEEATRYSTEREAFGKPISQLGAIQTHLANMSVKVDAARYLMRAAALKKDRGQSVTREAAEAKLFASETCMEVCTKGIQVLGGYGYTMDYAMERHFRDAKITEIYEGTSEIQRIVIARGLVKEILGEV